MDYITQKRNSQAVLGILGKIISFVLVFYVISAKNDRIPRFFNKMLAKYFGNWYNQGRYT